MALYKTRKRYVIKEAKERLKSIISQTTNLTEIEWADKDIQYPIKKALCEFVAIIKENKLEYLIQDLRDIDCLFDCCIDDGIAEDNVFTLLCLQTYLPIILDSISSKA